MRQNRNLLIQPLSAALLLSLYLVAFSLAMQDAPGALLLHQEEGCDLSQTACRVSAPGYAFRIEMSPRPVPLLDPVTVRLQPLKGDIGHVRLKITGIENDMGIVERELKSAADGALTAVVYMGICSRSIMTWRMHLEGVIDRRPFSAILRFKTRANRPVEIIG